MQTRYAGEFAAIAVMCLCPALAGAQDVVPAASGRAAGAARVAATPSPAPFGAAADVNAAGQSPDQRGGVRGFMADVGADYRNFFSVETAEWFAVGGTAALAVHGADEFLREELHDEDDPVVQTLEMKGGAQYGNLAGQVPLAVGWWAIGHAMGSARGAAAGRDLLRAQISTLSWTYAIKYSVNRTRPNGDPRSFPSGHASAAFATAMVLQEHYGWKLGVPMFAAATYTALSRLTVDKHWASDVTFGAVVGMTCARAVTVHVRRTRVAVLPQALPGGGAVTFSVMRYSS